jgi:hypothetical protein
MIQRRLFFIILLAATLLIGCTTEPAASTQGSQGTPPALLDSFERSTGVKTQPIFNITPNTGFHTMKAYGSAGVDPNSLIGQVVEITAIGDLKPLSMPSFLNSTATIGTKAQAVPMVTSQFYNSKGAINSSILGAFDFNASSESKTELSATQVAFISPSEQSPINWLYASCFPEIYSSSTRTFVVIRAMTLVNLSLTEYSNNQASANLAIAVAKIDGTMYNKTTNTRSGLCVIFQYEYCDPTVLSGLNRIVQLALASPQDPGSSRIQLESFSAKPSPTKIKESMTPELLSKAQELIKQLPPATQNKKIPALLGAYPK